MPEKHSLTVIIEVLEDIFEGVFDHSQRILTILETFIILVLLRHLTEMIYLSIEV